MTDSHGNVLWAGDRVTFFCPSTQTIERGRILQINDNVCNIEYFLSQSSKGWGKNKETGEFKWFNQTYVEENVPDGNIIRE